MKYLRQYIRQMLIEAAGSDAFGAPYFSPPQVFKDETGIDLVYNYKLPPEFSSGKALQDWTDENVPEDPTPVDINDFYGPIVDKLIKLNPELAPLRAAGEVEEWMLLPDQEMSEVYPWHLKDIVVGVASEFSPEDIVYYLIGGEGSRDASWDIGTQVEKKTGVRPQWMISPETAEKHFGLQERRIRRYIKQALLERFKHKGDEDFFRVELPGIGYAQGHRNLSFKKCQGQVDELMKTPEYLAAEEKYVKNAKPRTELLRDENGEWAMVETGPAKFSPPLYDVTNAWIHKESNRGKGHGKEIYKAFIDKASVYAKRNGGVFVGAYYCTIGSGTSPDARRLWKSLTRDYTSSGDVIFIGL